MNRKQSEKKANLIVQELKSNGMYFPVSLNQILPMLPNNPGHVVRELAQKGYIANPELYDGSLPLGTAQRLESLGVLNRASLREMIAAGHLNLDAIRNVGSKRRNIILKWAQLSPDEGTKRAIRLKVPLRVIRHLRDFVTSADYAGLHEIVRSLVEEVLVTSGDLEPPFKRSRGDPMQTARAP